MHTGNPLNKLAVALFGLLMFAAATPALAATFDEIIAMQDAGIAPETIIEVIEATGLDEPLDVDALIYLAENDVDTMILDFLIDALPTDAAWVDLEEDSYARYEDISDHPNWAGGGGFHRGGTGYNPLRNRDDSNRYWEGSDGYYNYYPNYGDDYRVRVYEPPVYILDDNPYRAYRVPRVYNYNTNRYRNPYTYTSPNYYVHPGNRNYRYYDNGWGGNLWGGRGHHGYRNRWESSINFWWHDDDLSLRFSF